MLTTQNKKNASLPYIVGLTGGIASGKTTVANLFIELGINAVDADVVAREVVEPNTSAFNAIVEHFGKDVIQADGYLNRAMLREKVFSQPNEKEWLNNLLHPIIRTEIFKQINNTTSDYCLLIAPLLFENALHLACDRTLVIDVDEATQIIRVQQRDNSNIEIIKNIIASQISRTERCALADDILVNQNKTPEQLKQEVLLFNQQYSELAKTLLR